MYPIFVLIFLTISMIFLAVIMLDYIKLCKALGLKPGSVLVWKNGQWMTHEELDLLLSYEEFQKFPSSMTIPLNATTQSSLKWLENKVKEQKNET